MTRYRMIPNIEPVGETARLRTELVALKRRLDTATAALRREHERSATMLTTVRSLFSHSVASGGTTEAIADHFRGRLDVLARYHHHPSASYDLEMVIREELRDFQFGEDARVSIAGPVTALERDEAEAMGLAIHELVTNALKFGALAHRAGRLDVRWCVVAGEMRLDWSETGGPGGTAPSHHYGVGRDVIEQTLPGQLAARTSFALRPDGVQCRIAFMLKGSREARARTAISIVPQPSRLQ